MSSSGDDLKSPSAAGNKNLRTNILKSTYVWLEVLLGPPSPSESTELPILDISISHQLTFHVHQEHFPALLDPLLQERSSLILGYVHVVEQLQEPIVDLLLGQTIDKVRCGFAGVPAGHGAVADHIVVVVVVLHRLLGTAEKGVQQPRLSLFLVS